MGDLGAALHAAVEGSGIALETFGRALIARFGPLNVWTAAILGGALLLDWPLARRVRASWRIALYAPVALRVALPLDWNLPIPRAPRVVDYFTPELQIFPREHRRGSVRTAPRFLARPRRGGLPRRRSLAPRALRRTRA